MGLPLHDTQNALRISVGRHTTVAEVDAIIEVLPSIVERLRTLTDRRTPQLAEAASRASEGTA